MREEAADVQQTPGQTALSPHPEPSKEALRLGSIAVRVPSVTVAERRACGASCNPALPVRCISGGDFQGGLLAREGAQFLERVPEPPQGKEAGRYLLQPGDLAFARVGGAYLGTVPEVAGHALVATENVTALRLLDADPVSVTAIGRYLSRGADGQLEALRSRSSRSIRFKDLASIAVPAPLVAGTEAFAAARGGLEADALRLDAAARAAGDALDELASAAVALDSSIEATMIDY